MKLTPNLPVEANKSRSNQFIIYVVISFLQPVRPRDFLTISCSKSSSLFDSCILAETIQGCLFFFWVSLLCVYYYPVRLSVSTL